MSEPALEYRIRSKDESKAGVASAQEGLKGFERHMREVSRTAQLLMGGAALGGVMMAFRRIASAAADCEKSFLTLHPEMQNASGSAAAFGSAVETMKVQVGGAINAVLSPFRQWFIDIIDPTAAATQNLKDFNKEMDDLIAKYSSAGQKQQKAYNDALAEQAAKEQELMEALARRGQLTLNLAAAQERLRNAIASSGGPRGGGGAMQEARGQVAGAQATISENNAEIRRLNDLLATMKQWLRDNPLGGKPGSSEAGGKNTALKVTVLNYDDMAEYFASAQPQFTIDDYASGLREAIAPAEYNLEEFFSSGQAKFSSTAPKSGPGKPTAEVSGGTDILGEIGNTVAGAFDGVSAAGTMVSAVLGALAGAFSWVTAIIIMVMPAINALVSTIMPALNTVLQPVIGSMVILGNTLGKMLLPVLEFLAPIIEALGYIFVWLYNNALRPMANTFIWIVVAVENMGVAIHNFIDWLFNWSNNQWLYHNANDSYLAPISYGDVSAAGAEANATGGTYGTGASYASAPVYHINIYNTFEAGSVIDSSGTWQSFVRKVWVQGTLLEAARQGA